MGMIILVDMDDVLVEFEKKIIELIIERYPEKKDLFKEERSNFKLTEEYPEFKELIKEIESQKGLTENLEPVKGSEKALKEMRKLGHEVFICTSPLTNYKNNVSEKYKWVEKNFGEEWTKKIILTKDKTLIKGDILIDDNPEINGLKEPEWEQVIFDRPYNRHIKNKKRLNWDNWKEVLNPNYSGKGGGVGILPPPKKEPTSLPVTRE